MPKPTPAEDLVNDVGPADAVKVADTNFKHAFLRDTEGDKQGARAQRKFGSEIKTVVKTRRRS